MGRSNKGQSALLAIVTRQCRCAAICWNAVFHIPAFESPTRATVVGEAVSPVTQSGCLYWKKPRKQPSPPKIGLLGSASASGGFRFDGTASITADAATAVCTCAIACCTAVSYTAMPEPVGGGAAVTLNAIAGAPRP